MNILEQEVIDFFRKHNIIRNNEMDSIINKPDYFADEAFFLMERFFQKFDIHKGYIDIDKFFNPLPALNLSHFLNVFGIKKSKYPEKSKITIGHMLEVAKRKEWFDPI